MTEDQVQERVGSEKNLLNKLGKGHGLGGNHLNHENAGRKGESNLTPFMREVISSAAHLDTAKSVGKAFGISKAHAHNLKHGIVTRPKGQDLELVKNRDRTLGKINERAADLVLEALGLVTPQKLNEIEKVKDLTAIAKDLSTVIEKTTPDPNKGRNSGINVTIYSPGTVDLSHFEVIDVEPMEID